MLVNIVTAFILTCYLLYLGYLDYSNTEYRIPYFIRFLFNSSIFRLGFVVLIVLTGFKYKDLGGLHLALLMAAVYLFSMAILDKDSIQERFTEKLKEDEENEEEDEEEDEEDENEEDEEEDDDEDDVKKEEFKNIMYATPNGGMMSNWDQKWSDVFDNRIEIKDKVKYKNLV